MRNLYYKLNKNYKNYLNLFFLYSISHIWILLLGNSTFWDDWWLETIGSENINKYWLILGRPLSGYMISIFYSFGNIFFRLITFFLIFINAIFLDKILKRIKIINENNRFIICIVFLIFPFYLARISVVCFPYTLCTFLFFLSWYLIPKNKLTSLLLFFISFSANSLLVFYALPIIEIFFAKYKLNKNSIIKFIQNNLAFLILPFLYYFLKLLFFRPYGYYQNYNENFNLKYLLISPLYQINDAIYFKSSLILFIPIIVLIFTYIFYKYVKINSETNDGKYSNLIFFLGIITLFFGLFPYWILGYVPRFDNVWESRHQLLMPLGFALITSSILSRLEIGSRRVFLSLIVTISLLINQSNYFSLIKDNNKQLDIITQLDNYPLNENVDFVFFEDDTKEDNALNRKYRFYEWQGILNRAYPKNKGIIALETKDIELVKNIFKSNQQDYFGYQIKNLPDEINIAKMKITYKDFSNEKLSKAKLLNHILFKKRKFKKIVLEGSECENIRTQDLDLDNYPNFTCKKIL